MTKHTCDRCGSEIADRELQSCEIALPDSKRKIIIRNDQRKTFDLCGDCRNMIFELIEKQVTEKTG